MHLGRSVLNTQSSFKAMGLLWLGKRSYGRKNLEFQCLSRTVQWCWKQAMWKAGGMYAASRSKLAMKEMRVVLLLLQEADSLQTGAQMLWSHVSARRSLGEQMSLEPLGKSPPWLRILTGLLQRTQMSHPESGNDTSLQFKAIKLAVIFAGSSSKLKPKHSNDILHRNRQHNPTQQVPNALVTFLLL